MNIYKGLFVCAIVVMAIYVGVAIGGGQGGGVPTWLNYQGRLTSPTGTAVADGSYDAEFRVYSSATGGSPLWSEVQEIATKAGVYSTTLGKATPFPPGLFSQPLWLESEIDGRTLTPRQELGAVAFAMTAQSALTVPAGAINSGSIANGSITGEKIAPGAILLGFAERTSNFFTNNQTSDVYVPGLSVNVVVPPGGRKIRVSAGGRGIYVNAMHHYATAAIFDGPNGTGNLIAATVLLGATTNMEAPVHMSRILNLPAGPRSFSVTLRSVGGSDVGFLGESTSPSWISVEAL